MGAARRSTSERGQRPVCWLLGLGLLLNLGLLLLYYLPETRPLQGDERYYVRLAKQIAAGHPAMHRPLWPPLYAELMGQVFRVFGSTPLAMQILQIAMWLAAGLCLHRIALRLAPHPVAAHAAAAFFLLSPELMAFSHFLWAELPHVFFAVVAFWLLVCHGDRLVAVAAGGVLLGAALLTKLVLFPVAPLIPLTFALAAPLAVRARMGRAILLAGMMALTVAPTMLGNLQRHGTLMIADSSTLNLWLGLNPSTDHPATVREFMQSGPDMPTRNAVYREKILRQIRRRGVAVVLRDQLARQYFQLFHYEGWFTRRLPRGLPTTKGLYRTTSPRLILVSHVFAHVAHALLLGAAAFGIAALRPRGAGWWNVPAAFLLYNVAVFLVVNVNARYFVQMIPAAALFAGVGAYWLGRLAGGKTPDPAAAFAFTPARLGLGLTLCVLLELLAFRDLPVLGI